MIGLHLLELAKTQWNAIVSGGSDQQDQKALEQVETYLNEAEGILQLTVTPEANGPALEIHYLREELRQELKRLFEK
jgi:hypothetical protein